MRGLSRKGRHLRTAHAEEDEHQTAVHPILPWSPRCEQRGGRRWSATPGATADTQNPPRIRQARYRLLPVWARGKWAGAYVENQVVERVADLGVLAIVGVFEGKHKHQVRHGMEAWDERVCNVIRVSVVVVRRAIGPVLHKDLGRVVYGWPVRVLGVVVGCQERL